MSKPSAVHRALPVVTAAGSPRERGEQHGEEQGRAIFDDLKAAGVRTYSIFLDPGTNDLTPQISRLAALADPHRAQPHRERTARDQALDSGLLRQPLGHGLVHALEEPRHE